MATTKKMFKVQKQIMTPARTAAGQKVTTVGQVWETIARSSNKAVAERTARNARVDNPNSLIRIEPPV